MAFELQDGWASIATVLKPVDSQCSIDGVYEPDLGDAGALVDREFDDLVVAGGTGRKDFCNPVRGAPHAALIELVTVTHDENIGLYQASILSLALPPPIPRRTVAKFRCESINQVANLSGQIP